MPLLRRGGTVATLTKAKYNLTAMEEARVQFVRCSGMHTKAVRAILDEVCVYNRGRYWANALNPFSSLEFVTPAFTKGIPEQLGSLNLALSEIAIYASLSLTLFAGVQLGGFAAPSSKYFN